MKNKPKAWRRMARNGNGRAIKAFLSVRGFKALPSPLFGMIAMAAGIIPKETT